MPPSATRNSCEPMVIVGGAPPSTSPVGSSAPHEARTGMPACSVPVQVVFHVGGCSGSSPPLLQSFVVAQSASPGQLPARTLAVSGVQASDCGNDAKS